MTAFRIPHADTTTVERRIGDRFHIEIPRICRNPHLPFAENKMGGPLRSHALGAAESEADQINVGEELLAGAEQTGEIAMCISSTSPARKYC